MYSLGAQFGFTLQQQMWSFDFANFDFGPNRKHLVQTRVADKPIMFRF
jgi:hypothetical protein